ncbi:unnamed protein product [Amoebophrya sp. A25]|nr:unnamed protein product [Amoebophrya sp. A25]|eukprot:GSA25T00012055001.1
MTLQTSQLQQAFVTVSACIPVILYSHTTSITNYYDLEKILESVTEIQREEEETVFHTCSVYIKCSHHLLRELHQLQHKKDLGTICESCTSCNIKAEFLTNTIDIICIW